MAPRIENDRDAALALKAALEEAGVEYGRPEPGLAHIGGQRFRLVSVGVVRDRDAVLIARLDDRSPSSARIVDEPVVVVADRISETARRELSGAGVAWLDRRGHLWVRTPSVYVNADVSSSVFSPPRVVDVMSGTGFDVSLALLVGPEGGVGVNELARRIRRSAGRVSEILSALRAQGLVEGGNRPAVPELFWDVADRWKPRWQPLSTVPPTDRAGRYRLTGTVAGVELGAPLVAGPQASRLSLYVEKASELSGLVNAYGGGERVVADAAVCPSRFGMSLRAGVEREGFSVTHHVVVALDLAQDRARGREILDEWSPEGLARVW